MACSHPHTGSCGFACAAHGRQRYHVSRAWAGSRFLALEPGTAGAPGGDQQRLPHLEAGQGYGGAGFRAGDLGESMGQRPAFAGSALDAARDWFGQHWLLVVNGLVATFIGVAVLTPVAYALGLTGPASAVFDAYRFVCAQTPSHSFYVAGYQCCLCARCLSIYCALLVGGVLLARLRRGPQPPRPLNWKFWLLAMVPMALDGGTQLFGWRESNAGLRILTGVIFGLATAWFMLPQIEAAARPSAPLAMDAQPGMWPGGHPGDWDDERSGEAHA